MSFRPTIAVYIQGEIADIRICPEWTFRRLLIEAVTVGALFSGVSSFREYRGRMLISKEELLDDLYDIEAMSDCPIIIDLSKGCIFRSDTGPFYSDDPEMLLLSLTEGSSEQGEEIYARILSECRIPFREHSREILQVIAAHEELRSLLSEETAEKLSAYMSENLDESGECLSERRPRIRLLRQESQQGENEK